MKIFRVITYEGDLNMIKQVFDKSVPDGTLNFPPDLSITVRTFHMADEGFVELEEVMDL